MLDKKAEDDNCEQIEQDWEAENEPPIFVVQHFLYVARIAIINRYHQAH